MWHNSGSGARKISKQQYMAANVVASLINRSSSQYNGSNRKQSSEKWRGGMAKAKSAGVWQSAAASKIMAGSKRHGGGAQWHNEKWRVSISGA